MKIGFDNDKYLTMQSEHIRKELINLTQIVSGIRWEII